MEQFGVARPRGSWSFSHQSDSTGSQGDSESQGDSGYTGDLGADNDHTWDTSHGHAYPQAGGEMCNG